MSQNAQTPVVYDGSFTTKVDTGEYPDLIGHIYAEFSKDYKEAQEPGAEEFVAFARQYLDKNPPVGQRYAGRGIGLVLQDGTVVVLNSQDATAAQPKDGSVAITRPRSQPGQHGISDTSSVPITGPTQVQDARSQDHAARPPQGGKPPGRK